MNMKYCMISKEKSSNLKKIKGTDYWVEENLHYHILKNCLYGADLDPIAVEIAKKNLNDKNNKKMSFPMNITQCDSLLKWEECNLDEKFRSLSDILKKQYKREEYKDITEYEIKKEIDYLCKFWNNEFDYIIGNPPYVMLLQSGIDENYWSYILNNYKTIGYKKNIFYLLIERVVEKLKVGGKHGFIIPDRYFLANSYIESRKNLVANTKIINVTQFSNKIFEEAIVGTAAYIVEKNKWNDDHKISLKLEYINDNSFSHTELIQKDVVKDKRFVLDILTKTDCKSIIEKIKINSAELKNFCKVHVGMMIKDKEKNFSDAFMAEKKNRIVIGRDLGEYIVENKDRYCSIDTLQIFGGTKKLEKHFMYPKMLIRKTGNSIIASLDTEGILAEQSVYMVIPFDNKKIYSLLGQTQSNLSNFYFRESLITNPNAYPYIQHYDTERIPINLKVLDDDYYDELIRKIIDIKIKIKNIKFNNVIKNNNYNEILYMYKEKKEKKKNLELELKSCINKSNDILYKAYDLKESEINLIESKIARNDLTKVNNNKERFNSSFIHIEDYDKDYYSCLIDEIYKILKIEVIELLKYNKRYLSIKELEDGLKNKIKNFYDLIKIIKEFKLEKENDYIIKEILNSCSDNWNKYLKNKELSKNGKELVKYSRNEYGLSSWSEEIHDIWFEGKSGT